LATAFSCSLLLLVAVEPDPTALPTLRPEAAWAFPLLFGYLGGTVFSVKSLIRQRGSVGWHRASVGWHAAWTVVAVIAVMSGQALTWVQAWVLLTGRAVVLPLVAGIRPLRASTIGAIEIVTSVVFVALIALGVAPAS
jgi:hypothetical protein